MHNLKYIFFVLLMLTSFLSKIYAQKGRVKISNVKLRACDGVKCKEIGALAKGAICKIIGRGKKEFLDSYGEHYWFRVQSKNKEGYVFGGLIDLLNNEAAELTVATTGYIREEKVNIRTTAGFEGSEVMFQLGKGIYCNIISKTKKSYMVGDLGRHPWYFIEVEGRKGYVFGGLVQLEKGHLRIDSIEAKVYDFPDMNSGQATGVVVKGAAFRIRSQSKKSQLIRPFGRHYWYEIEDEDRVRGWVYGAFTSKAKKANVDCQCVDFVKNSLSIKGPTKNAFEWNEVLEGMIPVTINQKEVFLDYEEIYDLQAVKSGDIVVFDKHHAEAHRKYGHIGIVGEIMPQQNQVMVEGANHDSPLGAFYAKQGCNNVSKKPYLLDFNVTFFRPKAIKKTK
ncbi:MAG: CHAP domain-containing protein [Saprospiraceae bacterium]